MRALRRTKGPKLKIIFNEEERLRKISDPEHPRHPRHPERSEGSPAILS